MNDKLSIIPENHSFGLYNCLWERYFNAYIITNDQQCDDRVFGAKGHSYGLFIRDIIGAGTGRHELLKLATERGLSSSRDKLDWLVQFLTLHLHRMNCAWGFLHDLANKWEAHPKWIQTWKLDSGDVNEILEATDAGLDSEGKLPEEVLKDIRHIIMGLGPIKQALLFQVVIPYYANQVYATVSLYKGGGYHTRTRAIQMGIKVTNQLHPPGYALTIKAFPDCVLGNLGGLTGLTTLQTEPHLTTLTLRDSSLETSLYSELGYSVTTRRLGKRTTNRRSGEWSRTKLPLRGRTTIESLL